MFAKQKDELQVVLPSGKKETQSPLSMCGCFYVNIYKLINICVNIDWLINIANLYF